MIYAQPGTPGAVVSFKARYGNFIGGEFVAPVGGEYFTNTSPVNGEVIAEFPRSSAADSGAATSSPRRPASAPASAAATALASSAPANRDTPVRVSLCSTPPQSAATGPNIIIINTDDMAAGQHFGFDGRDCLTPTLDTLASTGIRFTSAFAASTDTRPGTTTVMFGTAAASPPPASAPKRPGTWC